MCMKTLHHVTLKTQYKSGCDVKLIKFFRVIKLNLNPLQVAEDTVVHSC